MKTTKFSHLKNELDGLTEDMAKTIIRELQEWLSENGWIFCECHKEWHKKTIYKDNWENKESLLLDDADDV